MDIARSMLAAAQAAVHNVTANQQSNVVHTPNKTSTSHTSKYVRGTIFPAMFDKEKCNMHTFPICFNLS
jgi:hypothetical protein